MDEHLYQRTLAALAATHAAATPAGVRYAAYGELEAFKARPDAMDYAFYILTTPAPHHDDACRHFALQCLEGAAASLGSDPGPRGEQLRSQASALLVSGAVRPLGQEAGHVREAVARLVADLAERAYPQVWPGFLEGLLVVWQGSADGTAADLAMLVLQNVAEDCTDAQFNARLSVGRRNDILRGMRAHVPALLALTFAFTAHHFGQCQALVASGGASSAGAGGGGGGRGGGLGASGALVNGALSMVRRFAMWIRYEELLSPDHDFVAVCLACLPHGALRAEAADTLATLVARRVDRPNLLTLLAGLPVAVGATPPPAHETDDLPFWRTLGRLVGDVVSVNAVAVSEDEALLGSREWASYLDLATGLLGHPSLRLSSDLHLLFFCVFRMRKARGLAVRAAHGGHLPEGGLLAGKVLPEVLGCYWPKLVRPVGLEEGELSAIFEEEFGDEEELVAFFGQFRGQVAGLLRAGAEAMPLASAIAVGNILAALLAQHGCAATPDGQAVPAVPLDHADVRGRATVRSTGYQRLEAFSHCLETVLGALPAKSLKGDPALVGACAAVVQRLVAWGTRDPLLRCCQLNLLSACRAVLGGGSDGAGAPGTGPGSAEAAAAAAAMGALIPGVLDVCFAGMEAGEAWDPEPCPAATPVGEGVILLRRRAGAALISLGKALPHQLAPHLGYLSGRVHEMGGRGTLREMQRMHCLEMLVAVSNAIADPATRAGVVAQLAAEAVGVWGSAEVAALVSSPASLLAHCLGVDAAPSSVAAGTGKPADPATVQAIHGTVRRVSNALNTLQSIARRVELHAPLPGTPAAASAAAATAALAVASPQGLAFSGAAGVPPTPPGTLPLALTVSLPSESSFEAQWPLVLPNLLSLITTLHGVWAPPTAHKLRADGSGPLADPAGGNPAAAAAAALCGAAGGGGWASRAHVLSMPAQEVHLRSNLSGLTQKKDGGQHGSDVPNGHAHAGLYDESGPFDAGASGGDGGGGGDGMGISAGGDVQPLEEMRPRWLNELRTLAYALLGQCASQGCLYKLPGAAEAACAAVLSDLEHMEHRHFGLLLKHAAEPLVLHCPVERYATLLPPFLGPLLAHGLQRCTVAWQHFAATDGTGTEGRGGGSGGAAATPGAGALRSAEAHEWRSVPAAWRRDGGLVLGPEVGDATRELVVDKTRREVTRTLVGVLQAWLAITGDLGKAFINFDGAAKPWGAGGGGLDAASVAGGRGDGTGGGAGGGPLRASSKSPGPKESGAGDDDDDDEGAGAGGAAKYGEMDAAHSHGVSRRSAEAAGDAAAKRAKADALAHFLFLGDPSVAYPLAGTVVAALLWPDGQQCRRALSLAHRLVGVCAGQPHYGPLLGTHLMHAAVYALVSGPKWLAGLEWDLLNLARDLYCLFAVGLSSDKLTYAVASTRGAAGGREGAPLSAAVEAAAAKALARQLSPVSGRPRAVLLEVRGVTPEAVAGLDRLLCVGCTDTKSQKDALREVLLLGADGWHAHPEASGRRGVDGRADGSGGGGAVVASGAGSFVRCRPPAILDLPRQAYPSTSAGGSLRRGGNGQGIAARADDALTGLSSLFEE